MARAARKRIATAPLPEGPVDQRIGRNGVLSGYGNGPWRPEGHARCAGCRGASWWRTAALSAWRCAACTPPVPWTMEQPGYETVTLEKQWWECVNLQQVFPNALRGAGRTAGQWLMDHKLDGVPMVQWTVADWEAFMATVCYAYIAGARAEVKTL